LASAFAQEAAVLRSVTTVFFNYSVLNAFQAEITPGKIVIIVPKTVLIFSQGVKSGFYKVSHTPPRALKAVTREVTAPTAETKSDCQVFNGSWASSKV
jgi:hypothetical protein